MNRLLNILLITDQRERVNLEAEGVIRRMARVLSVGRPALPDFEVDYPLPEDAGPMLVERFAAGVAKSFPLDMILWVGPGSTIMPMGVDKAGCPAAAIVTGSPPEDRLTLKCLSQCTRVFCASEGAAQKLRAAGLPNACFLPFVGGDGLFFPHFVLEMFRLLLSGEAANPPELYRRAAAETKAFDPGKTAAAGPDGSGARSFIIPVLDDSPASPYNFGTLLDDLEAIPGEVIAVFNGPGAHGRYGGSARITRQALLSENTGVGRAWNIGLMLATTPTVFFLNADLRIGIEAVTGIEKALFSSSSVCMAGPAGGFVNFDSCEDIFHVDGRRHAGPTLVDQVCGHCFAVKRELFSTHGMGFYPELLPCWLEETDIALQARQHDLALLRVPVTGIEHRMSGTVSAYKKLSCLGREYELEGVWKDNKAKLLERWKDRLPGRDSVFVPSLLS